MVGRAHRASGPYIVTPLAPGRPTLASRYLAIMNGIGRAYLGLCLLGLLALVFLVLIGFVSAVVYVGASVLGAAGWFAMTLMIIVDVLVGLYFIAAVAR